MPRRKDDNPPAPPPTISDATGVYIRIPTGLVDPELLEVAGKHAAAGKKIAMVMIDAWRAIANAADAVTKERAELERDAAKLRRRRRRPRK